VGRDFEQADVNPGDRLKSERVDGNALQAGVLRGGKKRDEEESD